MSIVVLWSENDHKARAELLAQTYNSTAFNIKTTPKPIKVNDADTLVFWGHGVSGTFCELPAGEFLETVSAWKDVNRDVQTVEMISCNLRHREGDKPDSYTMKVVDRMKRKHSKIRFKALPVAVTKMGLTCEHSILKWHPGTKTWAYCAAPGRTDGAMWKFCHLLEAHMPPMGTNNGYVRSHQALVASDYLLTHKFGKDKFGALTFDDQCPRDHLLCLANNGDMSTGTIGTLRWNLVEIK